MDVYEVKMYKIEIRQKNSNKLEKSKKYESKEAYEKWLDMHTKHYGSVYLISGFVLEISGWTKIC